MLDGDVLPRFSVVISTSGRRASLRNTIESFRHMNYAAFELCVVHGPSSDGTEELVRAYTSNGTIKSSSCPELNLSRSRNIGIAMAAGDIVAFIDDDAIPEPEWLSDLAVAFEDEQTAAAGGIVLDPSGYTHQYLYAACDRLGNAKLNLTQPATEYNFPFSNLFPYVQGTNGAFRRNVLVDLGGFDEEYEFYLDETDVCCRLVDAGLIIRQLHNAVVHHKFLPSHLRNEARITTVKYPVIKNKIYFSLMNNHGHFSLDEAIRDAVTFVGQQRSDLHDHVSGGRLPPTILEDFEQDADRAWNVGLQRGLSGERRTRPPEYFTAQSEFRPFPAVRPAEGRRTFVFLSQTYPPAGMDGVARYTQNIAQAISGLGHTVHVIARGRGDNTVDLENGVWVHRLVPKQTPPRSLPSGMPIPQHIVNQSGTALEELYRIARTRPLHVVEGTSWDCECIVPVLDGRFASVTNVVTTLSHWLETHRDLRDDDTWMHNFGGPMLEAEGHLFHASSGILAASHAIARSVEERYDISFRPGQIGYLPHGLADMRPLPRSMPPGLSASGQDNKDSRTLKVLCVGRLELRKGIDVLLSAAKLLMRRHDNVEFWLAGDDTITLDSGLSARQLFQNAAIQEGTDTDRVRFLGSVTDEQLRWLYAECDIYVSPSRYESFGLIFVEAMMFAKPSVGCRIGGPAEVLEDGVDGLLCEPEDVAGLVKALEQLVLDPELRERLGREGRRSFERKFEASRIVKDRVRFLLGFAREAIPQRALRVIGSTQQMDVGFGEVALSLGPRSDLCLTTNARLLHVTFWTHPWSGIAEIWANGDPVEQIDLFAAEGAFRTVTVAAPEGQLCEFKIRRLCRQAEAASSDEVIFHSASASSPPEALAGSRAP